ncbi:Ig-like domain-containing protein [Citrobacter amalonaticus]|nr:Ig-like domain-containing protein [Citrobacter amalonaticus]
MARQMATGKASAEIEQWLNRVGTARVQMQLDEEFSLKNSSVDLLIPWYDSPEALVFSQHSLHRTDDRTQGNLGAGYRYYTPDWMAGVNAFYDYDFSGEHSRMGMGLEYGRDYLKLAANGYFRLSGWKNASDLADYEARPANGWDIRSEGYLPVYPQLGGKLVYEQYYGKEVGLFGRDNRQQDPRAVTAGLSYTPFPLMTLSADHRMGEGGENDTRLGVEFSWQFDTPLHKLLDTDAVGQMRTLAGSRYHLVDRNNNIVLEYREKNNLTLKMAEALRGYQGDRLSLDVVVNARHGLERIVWDDSTLRAAGGEVTCTANTQCVVTLPLWKTGGIDANTYVISAVAHDKAGNHSPQASTHIFVEQSAVNADNSTFEIVPTDDPNARAAVIEADDVTTATMTFRALDGQSLPISSLNPEILQHESSLGGLTISSVREVSAGVYVATVSGNTAGEAWMAPVVNGSALSSLRKPVTFVTSAISVNFIVVTDNAIADGVLPNSVKATLTDDEGNPLADKVVNFSVDNGATIAASGTTGPDGSVIMTLTSTVAGAATVTASINGNSESVNVTFTADAGSAHIADGALERVTNDAVANGSATNSVKATVTDANGNPLSGQTVNFSADNGATIAASGTTGDDGAVTMTLTSTVAGDSTVTASINGSSQSVSVTFVADTSTARIADGALERVANDALANGSATNSVKATVTDANGNPLSGQVVNFSADNGATILASGTTSADGTVTMTLTSTVAGDATVTASINSSSQSVSVTFTADTGTARIAAGALERVTNDALANGSATNSVKATVTDAQGNLLSGQVVNFSAGNGASIVASGTTGNDGTVTMTLTSTVVGDSTVTASINNSSESVDVTFVADTGTAQIADGALEIVETGARADGETTNSVKATVTDARGTPLPDQIVTFSADNGATIAASGTTGGNGTVTMMLTSRVAGDSTVTASINGSSQSVRVTFVADENSAQMSVTVDSADAVPANGSATRTVTATLTDASNNPLRNQPVSFTVNGGPAFTGESSGTTGDDGTMAVTLTSTVAGTFTVSGTASGLSLSNSAEVAFIADTSTAQLIIGTSSDTKTANGTDTHPVILRVEDAQGNLLTSVQSVTLSVPADGPRFSNNSATLSTSTDSNGELEVPLTSTVAGTFTVSARMGSGTAVTAQVRFAADTSTARLAVAAGSTEAVPANGTATRTVTATLTDAGGNPLPNQSVLFTAGDGPVFSGESSGTTGDDGTVTVTLTSTVAGTFTVSGAALSLSLNDSAEVTFIADASTAQLIIGTSSDTKTANGTDTHPVTLRVEDAQGNPLTSIQSVTLSVPADGPLFSNNTATLSTSTDSNGELEVPLTSTVAGTFTVSARLGSGTAVTAQVRFAADTSTARLTVAADSTEAASANGTATRTVTATLTDAGGNPLPNQSVLFTAGDGPVFSGESSGTTGDDGTMTVTLTSTVAGTFTVSGTASGLSLSNSAEVAFIADTSTAQLIIGTSSDTKTANGTDTHPVTLRVEDAQGNPLTSVQSVTLSVPADGPLFSNNTATLSTSTDSNGELEVPLTSTVAGTFTVSARLGSGTAVTAQVRFAADTGTARIADGALERVTNDALANGSATNSVKATVTDANRNPLSGQIVNFSADNGATIVASGTTGDDGTVTMTLTSTVAGDSTVTASINSSSQNVSVTFTADTSTAQLTVTADNSETMLADGTDTRTVTATLRDVRGNALRNQPVSFTVSGGPAFSGETSGITGDDGTVTVTLTSTVAGTFTVSGAASDLSLNGSADVTFTITGPYRGTIELSESSATADGSSTVTLTVKLTDAKGNLVSNEGSIYAGSRRGLTNIPSIASGGSMAMTEESQGIYTIEILTGTTVGEEDFWVVQASSFSEGRTPMVDNLVTLELTAGELHSGTIALSESSVEAGGSSTVTLTVKLKDINGNLVSNEGSVYVGSRNGLTNIPSIASGGSRAMTEDPDSPGV